MEHSRQLDSGQLPLNLKSSSTDALSKEISTRLALVTETIDNQGTSRLELREQLRGLTDLTKRLHSQHELLRASIPPESPLLVLHRVRCWEQGTAVTTDMPMYSGDRSRSHEHLQGYVVVSDLSIYLERYTTSSFVVFRQYECGKCFRHSSSGHDPISHTSKPQTAEQSLLRTSVKILLPELSAALKLLARAHPYANVCFPKFDIDQEIADGRSTWRLF